MASGLSRAGATVLIVDLTPKTTLDEAKRMLIGTGADKALLVNLDEWKTTTFYNIGLEYDLSAVVWGANGQLAAKRVSGEQKIGEWGSGSRGPISGDNELVSAAYKRTMEEILTDPAIANALQ